MVNHNHSFYTYKENNPELAKYIWFKKNIKYNIKWSIQHLQPRKARNSQGQ